MGIFDLHLEFETAKFDLFLWTQKNCSLIVIYFDNIQFFDMNYLGLKRKN